jgi:uncharacterized glyoxalase superfamily protein PhnB
VTTSDHPNHFTADDARRAGERAGIDWSSAPFDVEQFRAGMDVELEHGTRDAGTNVTDDDVLATAKIALAHLNEFADYYHRLARMEQAAEAGLPYQQVLPYLLYADLEHALAWLTEAFGGHEVDRLERDGRLAHGEIEIDGAHVLVGSPESGYEPPRARAGPTAFVYLFLEDVDAHYARAVAAGAEIMEEPNDQEYGDRRYGAVDPEGHWWFFAQRLRPDAQGSTRR